MISRTITLLLLCLFSMQLVEAQTPRCGHQHAIQQQARQHANYEQQVQQTFDYAKRTAQLAQSRSQEVLTVPVVVHVVYNTQEQNVSDELIYSQINVLNEDFQRTNPDAEDGRELFKAVAGNAKIKFELAKTDPDGNPTSGITRTQTDVTSFMDISFENVLTAIDSCGFDIGSQEGTECLLNALLGGEETDGGEGIQLDDVKNSAKGGQDPWDTQHYINIWVCNLNANLLGQEMPMVMGFAYPPVGAPNWPEEGLPTASDLKDIDGVVIHHQAFGVNNPNAGMIEGIFKKGRTCTHEMGHYFGLRHISGDGDCASDDGIGDTPAEVATQNPELSPNVVCEELHSIDTCPEDDLPDMIENFMSYNPEACQNLFTVEQVAIMRAMLEGPRSGLIMQQTTSTLSTDLAQALTVYPNPANSLLNIQLEGYDLSDFEVEIQNVIGQSVLSSPARRSLDVSQLKTGIYLVRLKGEEVETVRKISIVKS